MRLVGIPSLLLIVSPLYVPMVLLAQDREVKALAATLAETLGDR
jgi:hypothetical protein